MTAPSLRRRGALAALSAAMLALATTPGARAEVSSLRIGLQFGLSYLPVAIAQSEGLIAKRAAEFGVPNLQVSLQRFSGSTAMNEAVLSNSIEVGTAGTPGALIIWEKTRGRSQVKSLAGVSRGNYVLMTNKPEIRKFADLTANDRIAVPAFNSPQAILLRVAAQRILGDKAKADRMIVNLPHPDATASLLAGGTITGYFSTAPFTQTLERDKRITTVLTSRELLGHGDMTSTTLIASQTFVDDNPKVARAVLAGIEDAMALVRTEPKRAAELYLKSEQVQMTVEDVTTILTDGSLTFSTTPSGILEWCGFMAEQGFMKRQPAKWQDAFFPLMGERDGGS